MMQETVINIKHMMYTKIRKRFYLPLVFICLIFFLKTMVQISSKLNPPFAAELDGVAVEYYESPYLPNGDFLLLVKIENVDLKDFEKFTSNHEMKPLNQISDILWFDFHLEKKWWPYPESFKMGKSFYRKDKNSEFFACLVGKVCYVSYKTW